MGGMDFSTIFCKVFFCRGFKRMSSVWKKYALYMCFCGGMVAFITIRGSSKDNSVEESSRNDIRTPGGEVEGDIDEIDAKGTLNFPAKKPIKPYHKHDFFKDKPFEFDKRFKNPCWYEGEKLRCLPYYFILGIRKCATTTLYRNILNHPEAVGWGGKESQFFGYGQMYAQTQNADQISVFVDAFDKGAEKIDELSKNKQDKNAINKWILGDGSADYMYVNYDWTQFPGNEYLREPKIVTLDYIHHFLPNAKMILVLRDPVERLYSEYYFIHGHLFQQNNTNRYSFHKCVEYLIDLYNDCFKHHTIRECVYNTSIQHSVEPSMIINLGIYYIYMEDILRVYGEDQVLVLHVEDVEDVVGMRKVFDFLEMSELPSDKLDKIAGKERVNTRRLEFKDSGAMLPATRRLLTDFYKPFNERMASLMRDKYYLFQPI